MEVEDKNPAHIVAVTDFSPETLREIIGQLEISTDFEHLVYREAELDAIWSITGFYLQIATNSEELRQLTHLREGLHRAHDLVADARPSEAALWLRRFL